MTDDKKNEEPTAIVVHEPKQTQLSPMNTGLLAMEPEEMVKFATRVANALKDIIVQQNLAVDLSRGKSPPYVKVEGWITMGSLLGILPREDYAKELEGGSFEAGVSLVRAVDGRVVSGASSLCGVDETDRYGNSTWGNRPKFARRSMAITRATGKAYRLAFGWIMSLAGYNPTPLEEMPDEHKTIDAQTGSPPTYYTGQEAQKKDLKETCEKLGIKEVEKMKSIHLKVLAHGKIEMPTLESAVKELLSEGI